MSSQMKFIVVALIVALTLSIGWSAANANRSLGLEGGPTLTETGRLTFAAEALEISCATTLVATLASIITKVERANVGRVTDLRFEACRGSGGVTFRSVRVLGIERENRTLWSILYKAFTGLLPNPTSYQARIENAQLLLEFSVLGLPTACLYEGFIEILSRVTEEGRGTLERLTALSESGEQVRVTLRTTLRGVCPGEGSIRADMSPTTSVRITLSEAVGGQLEYEPIPVPIAVGAEEANATLINNNRVSPVEILSGRSEARYELQLETCRGATLLPRGTCSVKIRRAERATRGRGTVSVRYRDPFEHTLSISVDGR